MITLRSRLKDQRGFNLIELMIVIAIIGLLIGVGAIAMGRNDQIRERDRCSSELRSDSNLSSPVRFAKSWQIRNIRSADSIGGLGR
jgi:prepilin-type N-terminal cleavage/methylation domain-containing protein